MDATTVAWLLVAAGVVLALVGRQVFWLAVAIVGFGFAFNLTLALVPDIDPTLNIIIAVIVGAAGAVVTLLSLRVVAAVAGALLLGIVGRALFVLYLDDSAWQWVAFALGAVAGWALVRTLFDVGIIVTTALGGGWYVAIGLGEAEVDLAATTTLWIGLGVALLGVGVQTGMWRRAVGRRDD